MKKKRLSKTRYVYRHPVLESTCRGAKSQSGSEKSMHRAEDVQSIHRGVGHISTHDYVAHFETRAVMEAQQSCFFRGSSIWEPKKLS